MAVKPILFNTEMVRAILDGRKTQTRRLCKGQPQDGAISPMKMGYEPPYRPGDVLYVRETWAKVPGTPPYIYKATFGAGERKWRPSIHMPKDAARLFLRVTNVRCERLRDGLGCLQALQAEGVKSTTFPSILFEFRELWDSTIKPADLPRYGWKSNPWVWVIEFERCEKPW